MPEFSEALVHHFDAVCKWTEECSTQLKDVINFLKRRHLIELEYSKNIAKLCASSVQAVPVDKRIPAINDRQMDTFGSLQAAHFNLIDEAVQAAAAQEEYAMQMSQHIVDTLINYSKDFEAARKLLIAEGTRETKVLQDSYTALKKAQANFTSAKKDSDEAEANYSRAKNNHLSKEKDVTKLRTRSETATEKLNQATETLEQAESDCRLTQELYYLKVMPRILKFFEKKEQERARQLLTSFNVHNTISKTRLSQFLTFNRRYSDVVESTDYKADIHEFVLRMDEAGGTVVGVRSLLNPFRKGRMTLVRNVNSRRTKEFFFVLMADQRRLWMFDSEDSTKPRGQIDLPVQETSVCHVDESVVGRLHSIQIRSSDSANVLCLNNADDRVAWYDALESVLVPEDIRKARKTGEHIVQSVDITISDARGLAKSTDYFVAIYLNNYLTARTHTRGASTSPQWNEAFNFDNIPDTTETVTIVLHHKNDTVQMMLNQVESEIGRVVLFVRQLHSGQVEESWHKLTSEKHVSVEGQIRLAIHYEKEHVLPMSAYEPFLQLTEEYKIIATTLGQIVLPQDREVLARSLLLSMIGRERALEFTSALLVDEVQNTDDVTVLFRGNTIATKCVDELMRLTGRRYLQDTLRAMVQSVCESKASCEVDPARLGNPADLKPNWKRLLTHLNNTWTAVLLSLDNCPMPMKAIFMSIQQAIIRKYGDSSLPRHTAVGSFFFLRFICPAILSPKKFDVISYTPDEASARTLKLIAKTLQNLANLQPFGVKEAYMTEMNDFISANKGVVRQAIDKLASGVPKGHVGVSTQDVDLARAAGRLHRYMRSNFTQLREKAGNEREAVMQELVVALMLEDQVPGAPEKSRASVIAASHSVFDEEVPPRRNERRESMDDIGEAGEEAIEEGTEASLQQAAARPSITRNMSRTLSETITMLSGPISEEAVDEARIVLSGSGSSVDMATVHAAGEAAEDYEATDALEEDCDELDEGEDVEEEEEEEEEGEAGGASASALGVDSHTSRAGDGNDNNDDDEEEEEVQPLSASAETGATAIEPPTEPPRFTKFPAPAVVVFDYEAQQADEITVSAGEVVVVTQGEGTIGEGWVKILIPSSSEEGVMPLAYLMKSEEAGVRKSLLLHAGVRASVFMGSSSIPSSAAVKVPETTVEEPVIEVEEEHVNAPPKPAPRRKKSKIKAQGSIETPPPSESNDQPAF